MTGQCVTQGGYWGPFTTQASEQRLPRSLRPRGTPQGKCAGCLGSSTEAGTHTWEILCLSAPTNGPNGRDHYPLRLSSGVIHHLLLETFLTHSQSAPTHLPSWVRVPCSLGLSWSSVLNATLAPIKLFGMVLFLCALHSVIIDKGINLDFANIFNGK